MAQTLTDLCSCRLNLEHLVGTDTLRPFMHGFFIDLRLYSKAKTLANPFAYAEYRQKLINDKLEKERESRIRTINKGGAKAAANRTADGEKITVNKSLVEKLRKKEEKDQEKEKRKRKRAEEADGDEDESHAANADTADEQPPSLLADSRFSSLFTNSDFAIDESSREFAMLNPSAAAQRQKPLNQDEDGASEDEDESGGEESDSSAEGGAPSVLLAVIVLAD